MAKLIMWNVITLDGCFEGATPWDLSFHNTVWGTELEQFSIDQLHAAGSLVFGRVTYQGMAAYWKQETGMIAHLMNSIPKMVCSNTLVEADWNNTELVNGNTVEMVATRKAAATEDMYVFGSALLSQSLIKENLFDEYRICIAPTILGSGRLLFEQGLPHQHLQLYRSINLVNGGVVLFYNAPAGE